MLVLPDRAQVIVEVVGVVHRVIHGGDKTELSSLHGCEDTPIALEIGASDVVILELDVVAREEESRGVWSNVLRGTEWRIEWNTR